MFKRVTVDLLFTQEDEAEDFYHDCDIAIGKATTINEGQQNEERSHIMLQECHHDEDSNLSCVVLAQEVSL